MFYPWEQGKKPYFTNPEGFEWYVDDFATKYALQDECTSSVHTRKGLRNVVAFYVKKGDDVTSVLIDDKQHIVVEHQSSLGLCDKIFMLKVWEDFASDDEKTNLEMRKQHIREVSEYINQPIKPVEKYYTEPGQKYL